VRPILLTLVAVGMVVGLIAILDWLRHLWEERGRDSAALVGVSVAGLIISGVIVWGFHLPSWIGENYFGVHDLTEELRTACVQVHNYTQLPETDNCKELASGAGTISTGRNDYRVPNVPSCGPREVVVGTGTYEDGYWTDYECSPNG
jgi:hypothetical protein